MVHPMLNTSLTSVLFFVAFVCIGTVQCKRFEVGGTECPDRWKMLSQIKTCADLPEKPNILNSSMVKMAVHCRLLDNARKCLANVFQFCTAYEIYAAKLPDGMRFLEHELYVKMDTLRCPQVRGK